MAVPHKTGLAWAEFLMTCLKQLRSSPPGQLGNRATDLKFVTFVAAQPWRLILSPLPM